MGIKERKGREEWVTLREPRVTRKRRSEEKNSMSKLQAPATFPSRSPSGPKANLIDIRGHFAWGKLDRLVFQPSASDFFHLIALIFKLKWCHSHFLLQSRNVLVQRFSFYVEKNSPWCVYKPHCGRLWRNLLAGGRFGHFYQQRRRFVDLFSTKSRTLSVLIGEVCGRVGVDSEHCRCQSSVSFGASSRVPWPKFGKCLDD